MRVGLGTTKGKGEGVSRQVDTCNCDEVITNVIKRNMIANSKRLRCQQILWEKRLADSQAD